MTEPITTIETVAIAQETIVTSVDGEKSTLTQSTVTTTEVSELKSAESGEPNEEDFEEIDEDEDHAAIEVPDIPDDEPDDGRGSNDGKIIGLIRGTPKPKPK